jgi:predicted dehydrogenase
VDIANTRVEFEGGCVANITASRISFEDRRRIRIFQPDTYLTLDYGSKEITLYHRTFIPETQRFQVSAEQIEVEPGDALEKEIRAFVHSSLTRMPPAVSGEDGRNALDMAMRISKQIQENIQKIPSIAAFYGVKEGLTDPLFRGAPEKRKMKPWPRGKKTS